MLPTPCARDGKGAGHQHSCLPSLLRREPGLARLLPTPRARDGKDALPGILQPVPSRLLPTPRASDTGTPGRAAGHGFRPPLSQVVLPLLPTPRASDGVKGSPKQRGSSGDLTLPSTAAGLNTAGDWGQFWQAIARWETITGRRVPPATQPGSQGQPVLAPPLVEWLMGLPEQWVTDPKLGLRRTVQLRLLGNGVVPHQAAAALRLLLCPHRWHLSQ